MLRAAMNIRRFATPRVPWNQIVTFTICVITARRRWEESRIQSARLGRESLPRCFVLLMWILRLKAQSGPSVPILQPCFCVQRNPTGVDTDKPTAITTQSLEQSY
mmetsp:Transcript_4260/g.9578  ORF Transcript_4260/g.9578 Transcript_4260/m.9578 type:complete len:105 (-) Transcript_4260:42-356(-)